jgi:hypothetical protein
VSIGLLSKLRTCYSKIREALVKEKNGIIQWESPRNGTVPSLGGKVVLDKNGFSLMIGPTGCTVSL